MVTMCLNILVLLAVCSLCRADVKSICKNQPSPVSDIVNTLSERLANRIEDEENYLYSPLSISVALAMVYLGTRGETRDQMSAALNYDILEDNSLGSNVGKNFRDLISLLSDHNNKSSVLMANGVFIHSGYTVNGHYTLGLRKYFNSSIEFLPFADEELKSMETINQWIKDHTNGKIPKLISEPLDPMTVMVLMNAVYFKGYWKSQFPEFSTWTGNFKLKDGTKKLVPFMLQQENFRFYKDPKINYTFLELDYAGSNFTMLLILPTGPDEFPSFSLNSRSLCYIQNRLQMTNVMVILPKFKLEYARELSEDMINLGMDKLFSDKADLTGIREDDDLHVSLMVHKAMIVVDESGVEASAISAVGIDGRMGSQEQASFMADHPFQFYIIDKRSSTIMFAGRIVDP